MQNRELIHNYLKSLGKYLSRLDKSDADDVIREIESHIHDALELQEEQYSADGIATILAGFGQPRELAAQYVEHILQGTPPPTGFKAIQSVKKGATLSLYISMGLFGFGVAAMLVLAGFYKIFVPSGVGVWSVTQGNSIIITFSEHTYPNSEELLGLWLIPLAIGLGLAIGRLTWQVLAALKKKY
jgi:uncharacterized membrane protein